MRLEPKGISLKFRVNSHLSKSDFTTALCIFYKLKKRTLHNHAASSLQGVPDKLPPGKHAQIGIRGSFALIIDIC